MHRCNVTGLDVIEDEAVPENQIWMDAPGPDGRTIRYVFDLQRLASITEETLPPAPTGDKP